MTQASRQKPIKCKAERHSGWQPDISPSSARASCKSLRLFAPPYEPRWSVGDVAGEV